MNTTNQKDRITRRRFLELSSAAFAGAEVLASGNTPKAASDLEKKLDRDKAELASMPGKIALEEHFALPESLGTDYAVSLQDLTSPELQLKIMDVGSGRIAEMDRGGIELCIVSLVSPGIQAVAERGSAPLNRPSPSKKNDASPSLRR